jgi:chaperonin cofactor prefoldin
VETLEERVEMLGEQLETLEELVETLGERAETLEERVETLGEQLETLDERSETLESRRETLETWLERLRIPLDRLQPCFQCLHVPSAALRASRQRFAASAETLQRRLQRFETGCAALRTLQSCLYVRPMPVHPRPLTEKQLIAYFQDYRKAFPEVGPGTAALSEGREPTRPRYSTHSPTSPFLYTCNQGRKDERVPAFSRVADRLGIRPPRLS